MRILAGEKKGFVLDTRGGKSTRPLSARVKTSLFGILSSRLPGSHFYDFFAGNGAVGIEALSRGAAMAHFYEINPKCLRIIQENLLKCQLSDRATLHREDVLRAVRFLKSPTETPILAFLGPPYSSGLAHNTLLLLGAADPFSPHSLVVAEVRKKDYLEQKYHLYVLMRDEYYGDTRLAFFERIAL